MPRTLGRVPPSDFRHLLRYSLTRESTPSKPTPLTLGINWYETFDTPTMKDGNYWIGLGQNWGKVRGGHAICLKPPALRDSSTWYRFYDQGTEGACVGFASARMMTLLNRERYSGQLIFERARSTYDEWAGENYDGTTVRAGMDVLRIEGPYTVNGKVDANDGIAENRWARDVEEILACLQETRPCVEFLNSWGTDYPHLTRMPLEALERLVFREQGEASVVTDRP